MQNEYKFVTRKIAKVFQRKFLKNLYIKKKIKNNNKKLKKYK